VIGSGQVYSLGARLGSEVESSKTESFRDAYCPDVWPKAVWISLLFSGTTFVLILPRSITWYAIYPLEFWEPICYDAPVEWERMRFAQETGPIVTGLYKYGFHGRYLDRERAKYLEE
jgi:hypothetical protein